MDEKYMVFSSALPTSFNESIQNPSSLTLIPSLDDVTFHVLEIESGKVVHKTCFRSDYIYLSHHSGVHLHGPYLAITSIQHQCIRIYLINDSGEFVFINSVGSYLYHDDEYLLGTTNSHLVLGIKHRILAHLFRIAHGSRESQSGLRQFYLEFERIRSLVMWKSQLLDTDHLLIKFGSPDYIIGRQSDQSSQISYHVVYNMKTTQVLAIFTNSSEELFTLYADYSDFFSLSYQSQAPWPLSTLPSNNIYERESLRKRYSTISNSKHGGNFTAIRRILSSLPLPNQCHSDSVYFDSSLFSFDDKTISALEKPKPGSDFPVKFYSRFDSRLLFKLFVGLPSHSRSRRHTTFVFHPFDPFVISIQHTHLQSSIVNYHYRA
jgi:de-etiolated-1